MKHRSCILLLLLMTALLALAACGTPVETETDDYEIRVMVAYPGRAVDSPADYVYVRPGEDVYYPVPLSDEYEYVGNDRNAEYVDGVLILKNVWYPTTVTLEVMQKGLGEFLRIQEGGTVHAQTVDGELDFSKPTTLIATANEGYDFLGWTKGGFLLDQGDLINTDETYTVQLSSEEPLYANFRLETDAIICYHLNGGRAQGTDNDVYYDSFPLTYYHYPNAIGDVGIFEREGHTLLEYSEQKSGDGFITCPGGKIFLENEGIIELWLQWEKWSPDSVFQVENGYITKYTGSGDTVIIPGEIGGQKIVGIRSGAFDGANMKTLISHKNIETIEGKAFQNCLAIDTFYLHDTVKNISNDIFRNCNNFKNFRFNAAMPPSKVSQSWGAYTRKFERAVYLAGPEHNLMAVLSGSSSLYATDSPLLEELMKKDGYDFDVLNFGIQASCPQLFFMEFLYHFTDEGDVLIQAPEVGGGTMGLSISSTHIQILQSTYNAFRYVDISNYGNLFKAIKDVADMRANSPFVSYADERSDIVTINIYGDRENEHKTGIAEGYRPGKITLGGNYPPDASIAQYNRIYNRFKAKGVRIYYSFAPVAGGAFKATDADIKRYEDRVDEKLLAPRISVYKDYIIPQEYMYNSDAHTNVEGMIIRTRQLARDLLAQFKKEES